MYFLNSKKCIWIRKEDQEVYEVKSFTKAYHKYKKEYVKHLSFNPKEENLSKGRLQNLQSRKVSVKGGGTPPFR